MTKARTNADNASADIQGVTAGTGLSGGGTSGTVTLTNDMATTIDAKGDLLVGTGDNAYGRLAAPTEQGSTLVSDSATSTGLRWQGNFAGGKNAIINGDFRINQRNFTSSTSFGYGFDRWINAVGGGTGTATFSAQTFTLGAAPVAGYEGTNFLRCVTTGQSAGGTYSIFQQQIESVRTFANRTVTVSFWARAGSGTPKLYVELEQYFGTGGSAGVVIGSQVSLTTSWTRYSVTLNLASIAGKTIGTSDALGLLIWCSGGSDFNARTNSLGIQSNTFDIWGVQVETGNVATAFQTATGTLAGELAACMRYLQPVGGGVGTGSQYQRIATTGIVSGPTTVYMPYVMPVIMRTTPTLSVTLLSDHRIWDGSAIPTLTSLYLENGSQNPRSVVLIGVASAGGLTVGRAGQIYNDVISNPSVFLSAEL